MSKIYLPNSTQLDTLNEKLGDIGDTLAGQQLVTKDNVVSALGYEPAEKEGVYELIETVTLEDGVQKIVRSNEPDGTPYNFTSMYLYFKTPSGGFSSDIVVDIHYFLTDGTDIYNYQPRQIINVENGASCSLLRIFPSGHCTLNAEVLRTTGRISQATNTIRQGDILVTPGAAVNGIIFTSYENAPGEKIYIYGIRA